MGTRSAHYVDRYTRDNQKEEGRAMIIVAWLIVITLWFIINRISSLQETIDAISHHRFADRYELEYLTKRLTKEEQKSANEAWFNGWDEWSRRKKAGEL